MIYIANWKMNMNSLQKAEIFCSNVAQEKSFATHTIIICPSFPHLYPLVQQSKNANIAFGGQNCSAHLSGAYTGQVSSACLADIGTRYCIIGHSEVRTYLHETNENIANKAQQLLAVSITPIICIGETEKEYDEKKTSTVLEAQLKPVMHIINETKTTFPLIIAYEPVWAIGTGKTPDADYINQVFQWIRQYTKKQGIQAEIILLYGGSVDAQSASTMRLIPGLGGFLIGGASLDFQKFKNIVVLD